MVTQKEIAKKLNLSRTTVARALMGNASIKKETKEKVLSLANSLGYKKNLIGSTLASKNAKNIYAFIIRSVNENYSKEIKSGLKFAAKAYEKYNFNVNIVETDISEPDLQIRQLNKVIQDKNPDGIIIIPQRKDKIKSMIDAHAHIKFITLDIPIDHSVFHVGSDYDKSGKITANILGSMLREKEKVLVIDTNSDEISSKQYLAGFVDEIKKYNLNVMGPVYIENILENIDYLFEKYLQQDIQAIYSSRYLAEIVYVLQDRKPNLKLYTVANGMSSSIKELIDTNKITASVKEKHGKQGYLAAQYMFNFLHGEDVSKTTKHIVNSEVIFKQNLA